MKRREHKIYGPIKKQGRKLYSTTSPLPAATEGINSWCYSRGWWFVGWMFGWWLGGDGRVGERMRGGWVKGC